MKRQHLANRLAHLLVRRKADSRALPHPPPLQLQPQLQKKQFLEDQPPVGRSRRSLQLNHGRSLRRKMHLAQRRLAVRQLQPLQHRRRKALRHRTPHSFQQMEDCLPLPARGQPRPAQRLVHRRNPPHLQQARLRVVAVIGQQLELRLNHLEILSSPRRLDFAIQRDRVPGVKPALQIAAVEPDALQRQPSLPHGELEDGHLARPQQHCPAHLGNHRGRLARHKLIQRARILPVLIAEGKMVEQILGSLNLLGGQQLSHLGTHALYIHHRSVEASHTPDAKWRASRGTNAG